MNDLNIKITQCTSCPRLVEHRQNTSIPGQPLKFRDKTYWSKPVPGFGDLNASILIVGLAPGLHGANRTGRPFTGDGAGILLYKSLFEMGWSSLSTAHSMEDGLVLKNVYITNIVKCVPPQNIPNGQEKNNCRKFLINELSNLKKLKYIVAMGTLAHNEIIKVFNYNGNKLSQKAFPFKHGCIHPINSLPYKLIDCYHPSIYNVNTGLLNLEMMIEVFNKIK